MFNYKTNGLGPFPLVTLYSYGGDPIDTKTGTITETQIGPEFIIPAGAMGLHDELYVEALFSMTGSAATRSGACRIGAVGAAVSGGVLYSDTSSSASQTLFSYIAVLRNLGKLNVQRGSKLGTGGSTFAKSAYDFSQARALCFTCTIPGASDTMKLESVLIQIQRGGV